MQYECVCVAETDVRPLWQDVDVPLWSLWGHYDIVTLFAKNFGRYYIMTLSHLS